MQSVPEKPVGDPAVDNAHVLPQDIRRTLRLLALAAGIALVPALMPAPFAALLSVLPPAAIEVGSAIVSFGLALAIVLAGWKPVDDGVRYDTLALIAAFFGAAVAAMALPVVSAMPSTPVARTDNLQHVMGLLSAGGILAAALLARRDASAGNARFQWIAAASGGALALLLVGLALAAAPSNSVQQTWTVTATAGVSLAAHLWAIGCLAASVRRQAHLDTGLLLLAACAGAIADLFMGPHLGDDGVRHAIGSVFRIAAFALAYRAVWRRNVVIPFSSLPGQKWGAANGEARFQRLLDQSIDWYWEQDEHFRFTRIDGPAAPASNWPRQECLGKTRWELPITNMSGEDWQKHRALLEAHQPFQGIVQKMLNAAGEPRALLISGRPMFDQSGHFRGYHGVGSDITAQVRAEDAVRESEERFRSLLELSSDWYWEQDEHFRYTRISTHFVTESPGAIGKTRWELPWVDAPEGGWAPHRALLEARLPFRDLEFATYGPGRELHYISVAGEPVFDTQGKFKGYRGASKEITQRKLTELQLRDSEALARSMLDGLSASVCILDGNGTIIAINSAWEAYCADTGEIPGHVCVGSDYFESVGCDPGPYLDAIAAGIRAVLGGEREAFVCEYPRHSSRTRRWYLAKANRICGKGPLRVVVSHDDITPIKRAQQILSIEKRVLELFAAGSPLPEVLTVLCREFEQISWEGRYAVWALDAAGSHLHPGAGPSLPPTYLEALDGIAPGEGDGSCAAAVLRREPVFCADIEHDPVWVSLREVALLHGLRASWSFPMLRGGEVLGAVAVYFGSPREPDEAERELLEHATHIAGLVFDHARAEERRRLMVEVFINSQEGILITDAQNRIVMVNRAFSEITGYAASEVLGRNPRTLSSGFQDTAFYQAMWSDIYSKGHWQGELWDRRKNGDVYCENLSITTIRKQHGEITQYVAIFADITDKKVAEEKILHMNVELEHRVEERTRRLAAANKELEAFSYSVSHDLRAPLRSIEGFSRIVATKYAEKLDDAGRDYLEKIDRATRRMNQLIDDMLKLSRISMSEVRKSRVDLSSMARTILDELSSATKPTRSIELRVDELLSIEADPEFVRIALENLLANAWKFTSRTAHATIEVCALPPEEGTGFLVRDNGAGFDMKYAEKLFGAFQRLHSPAEFEGNGVGLALVRRIANLHGWSVQAHGEPGKGAIFRILTSVQ